MDLYLLRTFVAIAQEGHLTRAAERLHISQPTASAHIRTLEERFGVSLFARRSSGLELTNAGRELAAKAHGVLSAASELNSAARAMRGGVMGKLVLGGTADPMVTRLGKLGAAITRGFPLVSLVIELRHTAAMLQGIRSGEIDGGYFLGREAEDSLVCLRLARLTYRIVGPAAWRHDLQKADLPELAKKPWILTRGGNTHADMLSSLFHPLGLQPSAVVQADNESVLRLMVGEGVGLSLVRDDYAQQADRDGLMCVLPQGTAQTQLLFAYQNARRQEPLIQALAQSVAEVWRDLLPAAAPAAPA